MRIASIRIGKRHRQQVGDVRSLAASIERLGLLHPIVVDGGGRLVAGARRLAAVRSLGWHDVPVRVVRNISDAADALRAERDENTERKGFLPSELVSIARALEPLERAEAKGRQMSGLRRGTTVARAGNLPERDKGQRRDKLAAVVGVSGRTLDKARAVVEAAERDRRRYGALVEEMDRTGNITAAFAGLHRLLRRDGRHPNQLPNGKFRVVLADPPWQYNNSHVVGKDAYGRAERHYGTMSIEQICALRVKDHVERNAVLFLWVPAPMLMKAHDVIDAWGFTYKAGFVWDKIVHNFGNYVSVRHEHLLICTRGSCLPDRPTPMLDSVVSLRKSGVHSEKPEEFRKMIERLYPFGRRLELFGRRRVHGWTVWGDQVPARDDARSERERRGAATAAVIAIR